ncbi:hypothetical protein JG687_00012922 [Phytophthora cactorum]|uniref:Uncharacterized protein n=1 Tax=Phytophthora cactorum TaxID=29920 RepID=A0A8T1U0Q0_9STRA|nr:hypothetical protein JG687_00012922 [Phytophthora cactorum]
MFFIGLISALPSNSNNERYSVSSEHSVHTTHHGAAHYSRHGRPIAYGFRGSPSHADRRYTSFISRSDLTSPTSQEALRPQLYLIRLTTYADVYLLCSIAEDGVVPRWRDQDSRTGVRHVPSAVEGTEVACCRIIIISSRRSIRAHLLWFPRRTPRST